MDDGQTVEASCFADGNSDGLTAIAAASRQGCLFPAGYTLKNRATTGQADWQPFRSGTPVTISALYQLRSGRAQILERCAEVETGARNIDHILSRTLLPLISRALLDRMAQGPLPSQMTLALQDGDFALSFIEAEAEAEATPTTAVASQP